MCIGPGSFTTLKRNAYDPRIECRCHDAAINPRLRSPPLDSALVRLYVRALAVPQSVPGVESEGRTFLSTPIILESVHTRRLGTVILERALSTPYLGMLSGICTSQPCDR